MPNAALLSLLRLTLADGVGPVLGRRLLESFGSADRACTATPAELERVQGIGPAKARRIWQSLRAADDPLTREIDLADKLCARFIALGDADYPALLAECSDAPLVLRVRGASPCPPGSYPIAVVGTRQATHYGVEQAERFSQALAQAGLVIVSGGARGVDSAAHRAAARLSSPTVIVTGCGLSHCYPPENADLFDKVLSAGGTLLSELPLHAPPAAENFPARNRIIVGLSLGVLVIEAPRGSGALITARVALDEYNREVMAIPGRIDSPASEGSNDLIRRGEAAMVTSPGDVIEGLEASARHLFENRHAARYQSSLNEPGPEPVSETDLGDRSTAVPNRITKTSAAQQAILAALSTPLTIDELCRATGLEPGVVQAESMILEVRRAVVREGSKLTARQISH